MQNDVSSTIKDIAFYFKVIFYIHKFYIYIYVYICLYVIYIYNIYKNNIYFNVKH